LANHRQWGVTNNQKGKIRLTHYLIKKPNKEKKEKAENLSNEKESYARTQPRMKML
jgi:hypothetical protein